MSIKAGRIIRAADLAPEDWQPLALKNGWVNRGSGFYDAEFRYRPLDEMVELRGAIIGGTATDDTVIFNLPEGYRPTAEASFPLGTNSGTPVMMVVKPDGTVTVSHDGTSFTSLNIFAQFTVADQ